MSVFSLIFLFLAGGFRAVVVFNSLNEQGKEFLVRDSVSQIIGRRKLCELCVRRLDGMVFMRHDRE